MAEFFDSVQAGHAFVHFYAVFDYILQPTGRSTVSDASRLNNGMESGYPPAVALFAR